MRCQACSAVQPLVLVRDRNRRVVRACTSCAPNFEPYFVDVVSSGRRAQSGARKGANAAARALRRRTMP